jgi:hypothetical protein
VVKNDPDTSIPTPHLIVSYDMGWKKRSSGHAYNSRSGHGLIIGQHTNKVLDYEVKSKHCTQCQSKHTTNKNEHDCVHNFSGTSKSMEVHALKDIMVRSFAVNNFQIKTIICDDDTTMTSNIKWPLKYKQKNIEGFEWPLTPSGSTKIKCCGILPTDLCEPTFLDDPSHRKKVIGKHLYKLANANKSVSLVDKNLAGKISSDWGYMLHRISTLDPNKDWEKIKRKAEAVLDHRFNSHVKCGKWCHNKQAKLNSSKYTRPNKKHFLSKTNNEEEYTQLKSTLKRFMTKKVLVNHVIHIIPKK